ncbi:siderophore-interacting protein [Subtercola boreus]|nr:siderophore-interacting protein [Subtercola boreus]
MPTDPRLFTAEVLRSERLAPSFQRVTVCGPELAGFEYNGFDHWFRLFLPPRAGLPLHLPAVAGRGWYKPYLAIPEGTRPHCSNYTVAGVRTIDGRTELDIDVVIHTDARGTVAGAVAIWATTTTPGSPVALLDQGTLFDPPTDMEGVHLVSDESGLPALRGILRHLGGHQSGTAIIEVPTAGDIEQLVAPAGVAVTWLTRDAGTDTGTGAVAGTAHAPAAAEHHSAPGRRALEALCETVTPHPRDYAFVVGESTLATEGRRALHRAGLPKSRITFSGFWKHTPHAHAAP